MSSDTVSPRDTTSAALQGLTASVDRLLELDTSALSFEESLIYWERLTRAQRRVRAIQDRVIDALAKQSPDELGGELPDLLAEALRITRAEAEQRIEAAADFESRLRRASRAPCGWAAA